MRKTGKATYTDWGKAPQTKTNYKLPRPREFSGKLNSYLMLSFNNINYYSKLGHWTMQFKSFHWLSRHDTNMESVSVYFGVF